MKFDAPATINPIDRLKVVGKPIDRVEGPLKTTGVATYAYEHAEAPNPAYGYIVGAAVGRGRIEQIDDTEAKNAPGVLAVVTYENAGPVGSPTFLKIKTLAGPQIDHYHQAVALVVADTFEQARDAAALVHIRYSRAAGRFELGRSGIPPRSRQSISSGLRRAESTISRAPSRQRRYSWTRHTPRRTRATR